MSQVMMRLLVLGLMMALCAVGGAQQRLTLEQAMELALQVSPELAIERSKLKETTFKHQESLAGFSSTLRFDARLSRSDPASGNQALLAVPNTDYQGGLVWNQPLSHFGRKAWTQRVQKHDFQGQQMLLAQARDRTVEKTSLLYLNTLHLVDQTKVAEGEVESRALALRDSQSRFEAGSAARFEVLRAQAAKSRADQGLLEAQLKSDKALSELCLYLGLEPNSQPELEAPEPKAPPSDFEPYKLKALEDRPEIREIESRLASARSRLQLAKRQNRPQLSLEGRVTARRETVFNPGLQNTVSLNLSIPIFDGGVNRAQKAQAQERIAQLESQLELQKREVLTELHQSFSDLQSSWTSIAVSERGEAEAQESLRIAKLRYQHGVSTQVEFLEASQSYLEAKLSQCRAVQNYQIAYWKWQRVTANL